MIDISVVNIVKAFQLNKNILDGLSFEVNKGERIGILGKNGAGKTTLLRIITGQIQSDSGDVVIATGKRAGLISQIPIYPPEYTVEDVLHQAFARQRELKQKMLLLEEKMLLDAQSGQVLRQYGELTSRFEQLGGYELDVQLSKMCNGLGIPVAMLKREFSSLSGGEMTRINLARLLLEKTDILLLDEPTNHLDISGVEWLEEYLKSFDGTVLTVSHDRYFLDSVVTRIIEIDDGKATSYRGNYTQYVEQKTSREELQERQYEKEQAKIRQLRFTADRMHGWGLQNDKLMRRSQAIEKRIERISTVQKPKHEKQLKARFSSAQFLGDEALVLRDVGKSYGQKVLFEQLNLLVKSGERIGLIGDNGAGKTTLLRLIMQLELPDRGSVYIGPAIKAAYLPQKVSFAKPSLTLVEAVIDATNCSPQTARNRLGAFQFSGEDVFKCVRELSGGERSRLALCILMEADVNLLLLDEPTNHLDVPSRNWIENAVEAYDGALIFVSHDRYFINRFAGRIWSIQNSTIIDVPGGYEFFKQQKHLSDPPEPAVKPPKVPKQKNPRDLKKDLLQKILKTEREITASEAAIEEIDRSIEQNSSDYEKLTSLFSEREAEQSRLEELLSAWESLGAQLEDAEQ